MPGPLRLGVDRGIWVRPVWQPQDIGTSFDMRMKSAGLATLTRQQFMRHSDPKLTDCTYMASSKLPLASELAKLPAIRTNGGPPN